MILRVFLINILNIIVNCKYDYKIALNENSFTRLMNNINKQNGISSAEYVAHRSKFTHKSKYDKSFYDKDTIIKIEKSDGTFSSGIVRVSDHDVDLQKWCKYNNEYDFGISFIIEENSGYWNGSNIVEIPNRTITIYEYTYMSSRQNFDFLDRLIYKIINIKQTKKYNVGQPILGKAPKIVSNSSL